MAHSVIFEEDQICFENDKGLKYGLVVESAEYLSSDDEEEDALWDRLKKGSVRVAWHPDGEEDVVSESTVSKSGHPGKNTALPVSFTVLIHPITVLN